MSQTRKSTGMGTTYAIYGAILAIAMVQVVVAITLGPISLAHAGCWPRFRHTWRLCFSCICAMKSPTCALPSSRELCSCS